MAWCLAFNTWVMAWWCLAKQKLRIQREQALVLSLTLPIMILLVVFMNFHEHYSHKFHDPTRSLHENTSRVKLLVVENAFPPHVVASSRGRICSHECDEQDRSCVDLKCITFTQGTSSRGAEVAYALINVLSRTEAAFVRNALPPYTGYSPHMGYSPHTGYSRLESEETLRTSHLMCLTQNSLHGIFSTYRILSPRAKRD